MEIDFTVPGDHYLDTARDVLKKAMEHEGNSDTSRSRTPWNDFQRPVK